MRRIVKSVRLISFLRKERGHPCPHFPVMKKYYESDDEIRALVSAFENCSFHPSEFRHYQHLTVALWYVWHLPYAKAVKKMTEGIRRLADTYGKTGYHETITLFWLKTVSNFAAVSDRHLSLAATTNKLIRTYDDKELIAKYYSSDLLESAKAKAEWVEPDLKKLDEK